MICFLKVADRNKLHKYDKQIKNVKIKMSLFDRKIFKT